MTTIAMAIAEGRIQARCIQTGWTYTHPRSAVHVWPDDGQPVNPSILGVTTDMAGQTWVHTGDRDSDGAPLYDVYPSTQHLGVHIGTDGTPVVTPQASRGVKVRMRDDEIPISYGRRAAHRRAAGVRA